MATIRVKTRISLLLFAILGMAACKPYEWTATAGDVQPSEVQGFAQMTLRLHGHRSNLLPGGRIEIDSGPDVIAENIEVRKSSGQLILVLVSAAEAARIQQAKHLRVRANPKP